LKKIHTYALIIFTMLVLLNFSGMRLMLTVLVTEEYFKGLSIVYPLVIALAIYPLTNIVSVPIYISNKTNCLPRIIWVAALINIAINLVLIPQVGIIGACISTLASYLYIYIAYIRVSNKYMNIKIEIKETMKIFVLFIITLIVINNIWFDSVIFDLLIKIFVICIYLLLLKIFKIADIIQILKRRKA